VTVRQETTGRQEFVIYRTGKASEVANPDLYSSKHTTVHGGSCFALAEKAAFGVVVLGGHGVFKVGDKDPVCVETAGIYHTRTQMGGDEVFVAACASGNLEVQCESIEDLSFYQHFASGSNPESGSLRMSPYLPFLVKEPPC
jgi:hypothetical protein